MTKCKCKMSSIEEEWMFLDEGYFFGGDFYFQKVSVLLHYIIIFIYITHIMMCLIHILQYMLMHVYVLKSFC